MKYKLRGGPVDGAEMEPEEVWIIGELWIPMAHRRDVAYHWDEEEGVWAARYRLRSDGVGDFQGWERSWT